MRESWDEFFLRMVDLVASRSKDTSMKIGAVLVKDDRVLSMGYNGIPRRVNDDEPSRHERPKKYMYFEHGERNSIYNAAFNGIVTRGSTMYTSYTPCADCARAAIQAGVVRIVSYIDDDGISNRWEESRDAALEMLNEAGVEVVCIPRRSVH